MDIKLHSVRVKKIVSQTFHYNLHPMHVVILLLTDPAGLCHHGTKMQNRPLDLLEAAQHPTMFCTANYQWLQWRERLIWNVQLPPRHADHDGQSRVLKAH
jgi:hypothetical protein